MPEDYDNTLLGQYIRAIENPDSFGYNNGRWYQSPRKGDDANNRGFGIDVKYNHDAAKTTQGRQGRWLSEQEERNLRNKHIDYSLNMLEKNMLNAKASDLKKALAVGMIYRGDGQSLYHNASLRNAYYNGSDADFQKAINAFYNQKGSNHYLPQRANNSNSFIQNYSKSKVVNSPKYPIEQPDATRVVKPLLPIHKKAEGGYLNTPNHWDELSMTEKSEIMRQAVANGITDLNEIRQTYNEYADGGSMDNTVGEYADAIYQNATEEPYGDPSSHYNNVDEELLRTLKPDYRGHYSDDVKLPNHPSSPARGRFNGRYFDLTDKGMDNPNYTLFGLIDNGDGNTIMRYDGADVLPEITVTPQGNYYDDTYNNIRIRQKADGGNLFKGGGYIPSASIKRDIANFEGSSMKTNRSFEAEAKDFNRVIPQAVRNKLSQRQLDALYSYGYNVGMGNLKSRVLPTLTAYTQGRAGAEDVAASMWASKDPYMRGLQRRRAYERNMFTGNSPIETRGSIVDRAINMDLSGLPTVAQFSGDTPKFQYDLFPPNPTDYGTPIDWSTPEKKVETPAATPKEDNGLGLLALINQIYESPKQEPVAAYTPQRNNSMFVVSAPTSNNTFLDSSWFKEGGYLYDDGGKAPTIYKTSDGSYTTASGHPVEMIGWDDEGYARFRDTVTGDLGHAFEPSEEYGITEKMPSLIDMANNYARNYSLNQMMKDASVASSDNTYLAGSGKEQNPNLRYQGVRGAMYNAAWEKEHPYLSKAGMAAGAVPFAVAAYPFAAGAGEAAYPFVESAMQSSWFPYVDTGLTSLGFTDAANDIYNGNANAMTALDIAPMHRLARPVYELGRNVNDYFALKSFINRYGYNYSPKPGLIFDNAKLDKLTDQLVKQHNTFARGVDVNEARKYYGFPNSMKDEDIAEYVLTRPHRPSANNAGGNPERNPVLYTSNSIDLAKSYTNGDGYVGILQRPLLKGKSRAETLKLNDFRFYRNSNKAFSGTTDEPFILRPGESYPRYRRNKGTIAKRIRGKVRQMFTPVKPTGIDALAHQGSEVVSMRRPDDVDFRHYLFIGDEQEPLLNLVDIYKNETEFPVVDYSKHSVGLSKKKKYGGLLELL